MNLIRAALDCPGVLWAVLGAAGGCLGLPWAAPGCPWAALGWLAGHNIFYGDYHDFSVLEFFDFQTIYMNLLWAALGRSGLSWGLLVAAWGRPGLFLAALGCPGLDGWLAIGFQ
mgnify:CR=1 FL=1